MGFFGGLKKGSKTVLGSTHVVEQLSFFMFLLILIFDFYLILFFLLFGALWAGLGVGVGLKNCFWVYSWSLRLS